VVEIGEDTLDALVPSLILQPIVENAVRHGIEPHARFGRIELRSRIDAGRLVVTVADNGKGLPADGPKREGIGLTNTRARLAALYGAGQKFELVNGPEGGLCVSMEIPFSTSAP
jgi:LytS/YehU family sensor histidine kinase